MSDLEELARMIDAASGTWTLRLLDEDRVTVTPGSAFAVMPAHAPNAVRVAITVPPMPELRRGIEILRGLLAADPHDTIIE